MTWDRLLYFPIRKEGILKGFLTLIKNPKASAGFEPAILDTTVQHTNHCVTEASRSKPLDQLSLLFGNAKIFRDS